MANVVGDDHPRAGHEIELVIGMAESPITPRAQDFAAWYQDVVLQGDMAEPAEIVKGCMVIKPNGYAVWESCSASSTTASRPPAIRTSTSRC
jgi:hypothetical protein